MKKLMWVTDLNALAAVPPDNIRNWMLHAQQISPYLKQCYSDVKLRLIEERWGNPYEDEKMNFMDSNESRIRRILLTGDNHIVTYGRTVIPLDTYQEYRDTFDQLREGFIGESFLYKNENVSRSAFEYATVNINEPLAIEIMESLSQYPEFLHSKSFFKKNISTLWVRRSRFDIEGFPLLLTEAILPTICAFP